MILLHDQTIQTITINANYVCNVHVCHVSLLYASSDHTCTYAYTLLQYHRQITNFNNLIEIIIKKRSFPIII